MEWHSSRNRLNMSPPEEATLEYAKYLVDYTKDGSRLISFHNELNNFYLLRESTRKSLKELVEKDQSFRTV
ncbi:unnamed protein product [Angiostrongylus costaricensis]|uniref:Carn_acyltransf domain-containing protein n=1 Tax=Angiostrongylus costaricensis TaxID=334426 RepID=A0A0R3PG24_ANGCS|nr:unnamed protein product [Angiostrongylus costaricensis]